MCSCGICWKSSALLAETCLPIFVHQKPARADEVRAGFCVQT